MGTGSSKISADEFLLTRTREQLLQSTSSPRAFVDSIFTYLKDELRLESYITLLGSEQQCQRFIFLLASQLGEVFERLPITVQKDKKDWVLFQSIEHITKTPQTKQITTQYCQYVARFIVRLFQVYAALALSVLDNDAIRDMTHDPEIMRTSGQLPTGALGIRRGFRPPMSGGFQMVHFLIFDKFIKTSINVFSVIKDNKDYNIKYKNHYIQLEYEINSEGTLVAKINKIGKSDGPIDNNIILKLKQGNHHRKDIMRQVWTVDEKFVDNNINLIVAKTVDLLLSFIQRIQKEMGLNTDTSGKFGLLRVPPGLQPSSSTPFGALKTLPRPTPHCVTRALQLLSFSSGIKTPRTAVCSKQFMKTTAGFSTVGLKSFIDLFFDVYRKSDTPPLAGAEQKYADMLKLFPAGTLSQINDCGQLTGVASLRPDADIKKAIEAIKGMWKMQAEHTATVAKFMTALFEVRKNKSGRWEVLGINKELYNAGPTYLEGKLMPFAREILIQYYSKCETLYNDARLDIIRQL
jgi:hypothetical protein